MSSVKIIMGAIMIGGALLITGINVKISDHRQPVPSVDHQDQATPQDALINVINRRAELDQLREGRAGR